MKGYKIIGASGSVTGAWCTSLTMPSKLVSVNADRSPARGLRIKGQPAQIVTPRRTTSAPAILKLDFETRRDLDRVRFSECFKTYPFRDWKNIRSGTPHWVSARRGHCIQYSVASMLVKHRALFPLLLLLVQIGAIEMRKQPVN